MSYAVAYLKAGIRRLVLAQLGLALLSAAAFLAWSGPDAALGAAFGGGIVLLNSLILGWRVRRAGEAGSPAATTAVLYLGAAQRFVVTLGMFALGLGVLKLAPLPMLVAFAAGQMGYLFNSYRPQGTRSNDN